MRNTSVDIEGFQMLDTNGQVKTKTKAAMLLELESIKGLLLDEDDIPILQEIMPVVTATHVPKESAVQPNPIALLTSDQQDFFSTPAISDIAPQLQNTLDDLDAAIENNISNRPSHEKNKNLINRPTLAKASGENPFLPEHIRSRLHGNNPPPLFAFETAQKIARSNRPTQLLGNTQNNALLTKPVTHQQELINELIESILPELERELRERLEMMSKEMLEILIAENK